MHGPQPQPSTPVGRLDHDIDEPCAECGAEVIADVPDGGLNCARCGQWEALCHGCMPKVPEHAADAVWCCPECRETLDS